MAKSEIIRDLGFGERNIPLGSHISLIYENQEEQIDMLAKFLQSGINNNEKVLILIDSLTPDELIYQLEERR